MLFIIVDKTLSELVLYKTALKIPSKVKKCNSFFPKHKCLFNLSLVQRQYATTQNQNIRNKAI